MSGKCIHTLICFLYLLVALAFRCNAQLEEKVSVSFDEKSLIEVINTLEDQFDIRFFYKEEWLRGKTISASFTNERLEDVLTTLFKKNNLAYFVRKPNFIVLLLDEGFVMPTRIDSTLSGRLSIGSIDLENENATISGTVMDGKTNQPLESAIISVENNPIRYITLADGFFEINLPIGNYEIKFHHPSMIDFIFPVSLNSDGSLIVDMFEDVTVLQEVVVNTQSIDQNISKTITGKDIIDIATIKTIPAFLGEADVFNSVLSLPGVSKIGEGSSGINVRGGGVGQNLILLDNSTIYNPSHLFGFFSTFNTDIVSKVNFYKGTVPVEFGGRLSAVMDVEVKSGSKQKVQGSGGVGLINSRIMLEGPLEVDSTTFVVSVRAAYPSYLLRGLEDPEINSSSAYFGDANVKIDHLINTKNRISATGYWSRDLFRFSDELEYNYGNTSGGIEWNSQLTEQTSLKSTINFTSYDYHFRDMAELERSSKLKSAIHQFSFNNKFIREFENHEIVYGVNLNVISIDPGNYTKATEQSSIEPLNIEDEKGVEGGLFIADSYSIGDRLSLYGGIRYSFFKGRKASYEKLYHGPEPRLSVNYRLTPTSSIKLGYARMRQYVHFISNTTSATPIDLWKLSNSSVKPQIADQISLGYFRNFQENRFETSVEAYYKRTNDLIEYKNGAELFLNENLENELLQGEGKAFGLEFLIKKTKGAINGWISYTFSRTMIKTSGTDPLQSINNGEFFPTNFDQPHNFSAFSSFQISRRFSINANFTYNTGRPISYPESVYQIRGITVVDFAERNRYRIPDYHRLDISFVLGTTLKRYKKIEANWSFSIYNLYGRDNAYSVYFKNDAQTNTPRAYKLSVIARPVLAISYNFKF